MINAVPSPRREVPRFRSNDGHVGNYSTLVAGLKVESRMGASNDICRLHVSHSPLIKWPRFHGINPVDNMLYIGQNISGWQHCSADSRYLRRTERSTLASASQESFNLGDWSSK